MYRQTDVLSGNHKTNFAVPVRCKTIYNLLTLHKLFGQFPKSPQVWSGWSTTSLILNPGLLLNCVIDYSLASNLVRRQVTKTKDCWWFHNLTRTVGQDFMMAILRFTRSLGNPWGCSHDEAQKDNFIRAGKRRLATQKRTICN